MNFDDDYPEWDDESMGSMGQNPRHHHPHQQFDEDHESLMGRIYEEDQEEEAKKNSNKNSKNSSIPENLVLTSHDSDIPIIYINSKNEKPEVYPVRLATITLNAVLPYNFNLKVIALYLPLDEFVVGIKHEQVGQRGWFKEKNTRRSAVKRPPKGRKDKCDFYNQCTINVRPYGGESDELINMKVFPNGKVGFTGVKKLEDANLALKMVLTRIDGLRGVVSYYPKEKEIGNSKNFRKKLKQRQKLLEYISKTTQTQIDWNDFINKILTRGKNPYPTGLELGKEVSYVLCFLEILMTYYEFNFEDRKDIYHHLTNETTDRDRIKDWTNLMELTMNSFRTPSETSIISPSNHNYTDEEYQLIVYGLAADGRYAMTISDVVKYVASYELEEIQVILALYMHTNANYDIERIMETLDIYEYSYDKIAAIKQYLLEHKLPASLSRSKLGILYSYLVAAKGYKQREMARLIQEYKRQKGRRGSSGTTNRKKEDEEEPEQEEPEVEEDPVDDLIDSIITPPPDEDKKKVQLVFKKRDPVIATTSVVESDIIINKLRRIEPEQKSRFTMEVPAWSTKDNQGYVNGLRIMDLYSMDCIHISNINTTFNTNFILSQEKLHQILINKYNCTNCSFEPNYGGINLAYLSRVECDKHTEDDYEEIIEPEYDGCQCKSVSILIFPNITLITGGRSFRQIVDSYNFIKRIILTEFERILKVDQNCPDPTDRYPNMISSSRYVYLKKKYILDNPKNHFIIKKMGLLDQYLYK